MKSMKQISILLMVFVLLLSTSLPAYSHEEYYVQVGAFEYKTNALKYQAILTNLDLPSEIILIHGLYKVFAGPFANESQAREAKAVVEAEGLQAFIVLSSHLYYKPPTQNESQEEPGEATEDKGDPVDQESEDTSQDTEDQANEDQDTEDQANEGQDTDDQASEDQDTEDQDSVTDEEDQVVNEDLEEDKESLEETDQLEVNLVDDESEEGTFNGEYKTFALVFGLVLLILILMMYVIFKLERKRKAFDQQ